MNRKLEQTPIVILLALLCCALWGSAFPCIKIGYRIFSITSDEINRQILFAGMRFFLAGCMVILVGSILNKKLLLPKQALSIRSILVLALFQTVMQYLFFYIGLANTTGSKAAIVTALNVFFSVLISGFIFRFEKVTPRMMIGCLIGLIGIIIVNLSSGTFDSSIRVNGEGFILISALAYAFSSVLIKIFSKSEDPVCLSGYQFMVGGLVLMGVGFVLGGRITITSSNGLLILFYLALISAVAYTIWGLLLKYNPVSKVSVFGFTNPMFGVILSMILLNEQPNVKKYIVSLLFVCIGIFLVNYQPKKEK